MKDVNWSTVTVYPRNCHTELFLDKLHNVFFFNKLLSQIYTTPSLHDLVFTNEPDMVRGNSCLLHLGNSDVCLYFSLLCYTHFKDTRRLRYNSQVIDYDLMCATLEDINWTDIINSMNTLDTWNYFRAVLWETWHVWIFEQIRQQERHWHGSTGLPVEKVIM